MEVLMRILAILLITFSLAFASDPLIINAHVRMLPKIMALDTRLSSKTDTSKKIFAVVYDGYQKSEAQSIADAINKTHNGKVSTLSFSAISLSTNELIERKDIAFVYVIQKCNPKSLKKIASWGIENSIPTFSYDVADLEYGILGSIAIERTSIIYISKKNLKEGKYHFDEALYQITRFVE